MACFDVIAILLFFTLIHSSYSLNCYQCEKENCTKNELPLVDCGEAETHCVTLTINRYKVIRDCAAKHIETSECNVYEKAKQTCKLCTTDACNNVQQETLICRVCDWSFKKSCHIRHRCHIPFGTSNVHCYAVYHRMRGFNFGCTSESPSDVDFIMEKDTWGIFHRLCDSHDCNDEIRFLPADHMFEEYRMCYECFGTMCGYTICNQPHSEFGMFCYRDWLYKKWGCASDLPLFQLTLGLKKKNLVLCASNNCNDAQFKPGRLCTDSEGAGHFCPTLSEQCVSFREDDEFKALGCSGEHKCWDKENCYFCNISHNCNNPDVIQKDYSLCYDCNDEPGCLRIRDNQVNYIRYCYGTQQCLWASDGVRQMRKCGHVVPENYPDVRKCTGNLCNQYPTTAICYGCNENSRECVYSQTDMNLQHCAPGVDSCFVTDKGYGLVERGCGDRVGEATTSCHNTTLCNEASTVTHACHIYETDFNFAINMKVPRIRDAHFNMGWTPNVCTDVEGRPACYMTFHKRGMVWGCLGDLKHFKEYYYGAETSDVFMSCEGHYCNYLP